MTRNWKFEQQHPRGKGGQFADKNKDTIPRAGAPNDGQSTLDEEQYLDGDCAPMQGGDERQIAQARRIRIDAIWHCDYLIEQAMKANTTKNQVPDLADIQELLREEDRAPWLIENQDRLADPDLWQERINTLRERRVQAGERCAICQSQDHGRLVRCDDCSRMVCPNCTTSFYGSPVCCKECGVRLESEMWDDLGDGGPDW